jgi:uncharacterized protein (TIGR02452 family)
MFVNERQTRKDLAQDTIRRVREGEWTNPSGSRVSIRGAVDASVAGTCVLRGRDLLARHAAREERGAPATARVEVTEERTGVAARRLVEAGERVALLNFANGVKPGGGFFGGARAQEESLCRVSSLYAALSSANAAPYYAENYRLAPTLALDNVVLSPGVPFFRDDNYELLDRPFTAVVLTSAAPCLPALDREISDGKAPRAALDEIPAILHRRCAAVAEAAAVAAAEHGCTAVVLGALGCGAFRNDPVVVADAFAAALRRVPLPAVTFACFDSRTPQLNLGAFRARFSGWPR